MDQVADLKALDAKTFQFVLKEPTGNVLQALSKPSGNSFIMPKRVAETPAREQINGFVGWSTLVSRRSRKDPPDKGGWNAFLTSSASVDIIDPLANTYINAVGENAWFGWPQDDELVKLRAAFSDESDPAKRKAIAEAMQLRMSESPTHIFAGQWVLPSAVPKKISGNLESPVTIFWNVERK